MTPEIISKKEAIAKGLKRYNTGKPCKHGHYSEKLVSNNSCIACRNDKANQYYSDNKESLLKKKKEYYQNNREHLLLVKKEQNSRRSDKIKAYCLNNKFKFNQRTAQYRAKKKNRTFDSCLKTIESFYEEARRLTNETGVEHHVDHIIPINGKNVSGFHVPHNLRVIPAFDNISKGNRIPEEFITEFF